MPFRLDDRVAVVTGAGGRLGPHWVRGLRDAGATVMALDRDEEALRVFSGDQRVVTVVGDVTEVGTLQGALEAATASPGTPTILVNNAGIDAPPVAGGAPGLIEAVSSEEFRRILDVNLLGAFQAIQVFGAAMARLGEGSIVNIGSLYATVAPEPSFYDHLDPPFLKPPAYGASKAGLLQLTRYFARLWGPSGVRVNMLSPGGVAGGQDAAFVEKFTARVALRRLADGTELVGSLVFLASDAASYVTGVNLNVDGGFTA